MLEDLQQNVIYQRNHYLMALIGIGGWDLPLGDLIILLSQGEALDHFEIILVAV